MCSFCFGWYTIWFSSIFFDHCHLKDGISHSLFSLVAQKFALAICRFNIKSFVYYLFQYTEDVKAGSVKFHYCTINKRLGASPSDLRSFDIDNHIAVWGWEVLNLSWLMRTMLAYNMHKASQQKTMTIDSSSLEFWTSLQPCLASCSRLE